MLLDRESAGRCLWLALEVDASSSTTAATRAAPRLDPMAVDYLQKILTAKVYDVAIESPLELAPTLSRRLGNRVLLKREDQQPVFSFKLRGAYNKMAHLVAGRARARRDRGVGGQSRAGRRARRAEARLRGDDRHAGDDAAHQDRRGRGARREGRAARRLVQPTPTRRRCALQKRSRATFVHPYDDPDVIAGQGTIGMEILRQCQGPIDAIFVAIGGGGLIGGIAAYVKRVRPEIKVIGVQPVDSDAMARSLAAGRRVTLAARRASSPTASR